MDLVGMHAAVDASAAGSHVSVCSGGALDVLGSGLISSGGAALATVAAAGEDAQQWCAGPHTQVYVAPPRTDNPSRLALPPLHSMHTHTHTHMLYERKRLRPAHWAQVGRPLDYMLFSVHALRLHAWCTAHDADVLAQLLILMLCVYVCVGTVGAELKHKQHSA
jgi:hypothetical protein